MAVFIIQSILKIIFWSSKLETNQEIKIRKNDIILVAVILLIGIATWGIISFLQGINTNNAVAVVFVDGEEYGRFPLATDCVEMITLADGSYNVLEIKDGKADITEGSCPDKICVRHNSINKKKESIVCLPNKVVVQIENGEASDIDAITN